MKPAFILSSRGLILAKLSREERLSNTERGFSFQAIRQLYIACVTSVSDFAVQLIAHCIKYI